LKKRPEEEAAEGKRKEMCKKLQGLCNELQTGQKVLRGIFTGDIT
jgi:hypothetical protein